MVPKMINELQTPQRSEKTEEEGKVSQPFNVVLYNDDVHSFDEVIIQLIKALRCSITAAQRFAFEAHVKGKSIIYSGDLPKCLQITSVLDEIGLNTEIDTER